MGPPKLDDYNKFSYQREQLGKKGSCRESNQEGSYKMETCRAQAHSAGLTGSFCRSHRLILQISQAHSADLTGSERVARGKALVIKSKIQVLSGVCDKIEHILEYVMI